MNGTERKIAITPNVVPKHAPKTLTTGERCMGWLLVVWPVAGAIAVSTPVAMIMPQLDGWDYLIWITPLVFTVAVTLLSCALPGYVGAWALCALGDTAVKYGVPRRMVWPVVVLLCALLGSWLLGSVSGSWQVAEPAVAYTFFVMLVVGSMWGLLHWGRALISNGKVLRAIYVATVFINIGFAVTAMLQHHSGALNRDYVFSQQNTGWAHMYNPLLPQGKNNLILYTNPEQATEQNKAFLKAMLGCTPPKSTQIRGRIGYANTELMLFASAASEEFDQWLQLSFPNCAWETMPEYMAFLVMEREFVPARWSPCRFTRLPDAAGARRYIIHDTESMEYIFLHLPGLLTGKLKLQTP